MHVSYRGLWCVLRRGGGFLHKTHFSISKRVLTFHRKKIRRSGNIFHLSNVEKYRGYRSEYADSLPPHLKSGETLLIFPQMKTQLPKLVTLNLPDNTVLLVFLWLSIESYQSFWSTVIKNLGHRQKKRLEFCRSSRDRQAYSLKRDNTVTELLMMRTLHTDKLHNATHQLKHSD